MKCSRCGADLVEVDNPLRKEFRHRRGTECAAVEAALEVESPHIMASDSLGFDPDLIQSANFRRDDTPSLRYMNDGRDLADPKQFPSPKTDKAVSRWADAAMFRSESMPTGEDGRVRPTAHLINATPDPLGSLAALAGIYVGEVKRSLAEVTDEERREALREVFKNKLQGPMEVVNFHILFEGVTRGFTHQLVRGRRAFYAQETLRFAVVDGDDWNSRSAVPPGWEFWTPEQQSSWYDAVHFSEVSYQQMVNSGVPAEDARGLMPHAMTTRIHWVCSLRELLYVAGVRLCTQAQFEWRLAMASVVKCLREYGYSDVMPSDAYRRPEATSRRIATRVDAWQFEAIANLMRPVCYQEGACGFKAKADRSCTIRDRVDFREKHSLNRKDSSKWHLPLIADVVRYPHGADPDHGTQPYVSTETSPGIDPAEWLADPGAAR